MSESKKELIEEHKRLTRILKDGTLKDRLEEYERQMKELKALLQGEEYKPANSNKLDKSNIKPAGNNYKGSNYVRYQGKWHRLLDEKQGNSLNKPTPTGYSGPTNWLKLEGLPEEVNQFDTGIEERAFHPNEIPELERQFSNEPPVIHGQDMNKSNYGPKGAGLYDPTVNQKRKAKNVDSIEGIGQNKNVKQYTTSREGTANEYATVQAKKDLAANKRQPVKTEKDLSPEEREKKLAEFQAMYAKSEDTCKLPPVETFIEHQMKQPMFSSQLPAHLQRISIMESSGGKNKEHAEVKTGIHKGTSSVSAFGLMPKYIKEVAEKFKPLKNSMLGKLIRSSSVNQVNNIVSNHEHDSELANHVWNYNQNRLSQHTVDPSHLEALGVAAHRRGITGALKLYKEGGINAVHNDPYVKTYNNIKDNEVALEKANAKLQLLRSILDTVTVEEDNLNKSKSLQNIMSEIRTRQPTDAEINLIMNTQISMGQEGQAEAEAKAAEERYKRMCEDTE